MTEKGKIFVLLMEIRAGYSKLCRVMVTQPESRGLGMMYIYCVKSEKCIYLGGLVDSLDDSFQGIHGLGKGAWAYRMLGGHLACVGRIPVHAVLFE